MNEMCGVTISQGRWAFFSTSQQHIQEGAVSPPETAPRRFAFGLEFMASLSLFKAS